jgi:lycopene cyclase domain-containing protein
VTYFGFLLLFLVLPLAGLLMGMWLARGSRLVPWKTLFIASLVALVYTTPWDNYLIANAVWWYDKRLVSGLTLGWVPLEEYLFFILQPLLVGVWMSTLDQRPANHEEHFISPRLRLIATILGIVVWTASMIILLSGWPSGTYLGLELVWAIPPLTLQLAFGADILWHSRLRLGPAVLASMVYLSAADAIAIASGTWHISSTYSLGVRIAGVLPVEECVFFLLTSALIAFTVTLVRSPESKDRMASVASFIHGRIRATPTP